jgi:hypothetical protein
MNHPLPIDAPLRLTCAAGAVLTTALIGLFIHSLAYGYDTAAKAQAATQPAVVAQARLR